MNKDLKHFNKVEDYFSKVDVYSKILKNNYMFHKEIFDMFKEFLNFFRKTPGLICYLLLKAERSSQSRQTFAKQRFKKLALVLETI